MVAVRGFSLAEKEDMKEIAISNGMCLCVFMCVCVYVCVFMCVCLCVRVYVCVFMWPECRILMHCVVGKSPPTPACLPRVHLVKLWWF